MTHESINLKRIAAAFTQTTGEPSKQVVYASIRTTDLEIEYDILRMDDEQFLKFMKQALPIEPDYALEMRIAYNEELITSQLSKTYAALKLKFGESGACYDDWKGAFAYPFLILREDQPEFRYVMHLYHYRSSLNFRYYRIAPEIPSHEKSSHYLSPSIDFSKEQMAQVVSYLINWLTGYFSVCSHDFHENFCKKAHSEFILFGYKNGKFFDRSYDDEDLYEKAFDKITQSL